MVLAAHLRRVHHFPGVFGRPVESFHEFCRRTAAAWPATMLTLSTHDTKRSADVRARINVLSEIPDEWEAALERWGRLNAPKKALVEGQLAPDRNDEYLLYQTLLGTWPASPSSRRTPSTSFFCASVSGWLISRT